MIGSRQIGVKRMVLGYSLTIPPIPAETDRAAKKVFGRSNRYLVVGDNVEKLFAGIFEKGDFSLTDDLTWSAIQNCLITIFQFYETLSDRQAIQALHKRIEWKYALHLPLDIPNTSTFALCKCRQRLLHDTSWNNCFNDMLIQIKVLDLFGIKKIQPVNATIIVGAVCRMDRLDRLASAMDLSLEALTATQPEWVLANSLPHWYGRYKHASFSNDLPIAEDEQVDLAQKIGSDAIYLLQTIRECGIPEIAALQEINNLEQICVQQFGDFADGIIQFKPWCMDCKC